MESEWVETVTDVKTVNWRGEPIHLIGVRALKHRKTGRVRIYPFDVAKAEIKTIADRFDLFPRDVGSLLMIFAKPGPFKEGEVLYKYHIQKLLFYLWKELGNRGYGESLPRDEFISARNGPVPKHVNDDLGRLEERGLIKTRPQKWDNYISKRIILTDEGLRLAGEIWEIVPMPYKEVIKKVKERIYPLDPETVRHLVHKEYPEYQDTYIENDIE